MTLPISDNQRINGSRATMKLPLRCESESLSRSMRTNFRERTQPRCCQATGLSVLNVLTGLLSDRLARRAVLSLTELTLSVAPLSHRIPGGIRQFARLIHRMFFGVLDVLDRRRQAVA